MAGRGVACRRRGYVQFGEAVEAWMREERRRSARPARIGSAGRPSEGPGLAGLDRLGRVWRGRVRRSEAGRDKQGGARRGLAVQGRLCTGRHGRRGKVLYGPDGLGRQGEAWRGVASLR